jgi:hypothetical protein
MAVGPETHIGGDIEKLEFVPGKFFNHC